MWYLLQLTVCLAVVFSNIHWQWTPNGYVAGFLGVAAAWLVTIILNGDLFRQIRQDANRLSLLLFKRQQPRNDNPRGKCWSGRKKLVS